MTQSSRALQLRAAGVLRRPAGGARREDHADGSQRSPVKPGRGLRSAISWSGTDVALCLFTIWPTRTTVDLPPPTGVPEPQAVRNYNLDDDEDVLADRCTSELDLIFDDIPDHLDQVVEAWLTAAIAAGAVVAWFGFEGSFHYDHILVSDIADQVYGVAGAEFVALAMDDELRASQRWAGQLQAAGKALD